MNEPLEKEELGIVVDKALPPLPNELFCQILEYFSEEELVTFLVVSKFWNLFIQKSFTEEVIFYQKAFAESTLWNYLSTISSGGSLEAYFRSFLPRIWVERIIASVATLDQFINRGFLAVGNTYRDNLLQRKGISALTLKNEASELVGKLKGKKIITCLESKDLNQVRKVYLARQYRDLESVFTLLMLASQMTHTPLPDDWVKFILNPALNRWLTGAGLCVLETRCHSVSILRVFTQHAIALKKILTRSAIEENHLTTIDDLLSRLMDDDWHSFLYKGSYADDLLMEAIGEDFLPIINHIGSLTFDKLIENSPTPERLKFLLDHMGAKHISQLLPTLCENFTDIVGGNSYASLMFELYASLTEIQFYAMVKKLDSRQFDCLINSTTFLYFLAQLDLLFPKARKSKVYAQASKSNQILFETEKIPLQLTCGSSALLIGISELESYYPKKILASKAAQHLTYGHQNFLQQICSANFRMVQEVLWRRFHQGDFDSHEESSDESNSSEASENYNIPAKRSSGEKNIIPVSSDQNSLFDDTSRVTAAFAALRAKQQDTKKSVEPQKPVIGPSNNYQQPQRVAQRPRPTPNSIHPRDYAILKAIGLSIIKGFFIGLLITGVAILLMMFINYQLNVPLIETINNLWIAGIAGIFADIVATACFLADAKIFEPSTFAFVNEEADGSKPFNIPDQVAPTANPGYGNKPLSSVGTATPKPPVQQTHVQASRDADRPNNLANSLY